MKTIKNYFKGFTKDDYLKWICNHLLVILGSCSLAFGVGAFLVPYNIVTGGLSGIGIILQNLFFEGQEVLIVDIVIAAMNILLFFIGWIFLGKEFSMKTLLSIIIYSGFLSVVLRIIKPSEWLILEKVSQGIMYDPRLTSLLAALCGSVFVGLGCALTFKGGGSTGGIDALAFIAQKYAKIKCSTATFVLDSTIIIVGMIVTKDIANGVIGIGGAFVAAALIDKLFVSMSTSLIMFVISDKYEEIKEFVHNKLDRGSTVIDVVGGYTNVEKKMLKIVIERNQYPQVVNFVKQIDPSAFISVTVAHEITGAGFSTPKNNGVK